jgi:uncharacterized protein YbjT (DUF2867 family)
MDYNDAPLWQGREKHHRAAIDAALDAGVRHIYYTSLAFNNPSKAGVMRAHVRTEAYLYDVAKEGKVETTIIREGLYSEAWCHGLWSLLLSLLSQLTFAETLLLVLH